MKIFAAALILTVALSTSCRHTQQQSGCDQTVQQKCGTNPFVKNLEDELRITQLPKGLIKETKSCANASADAALKGTETVKGEVKACIERSATVDADTRDKLFALVDKVRVSDKEYDGWVDCKLGACADLPVIVLMDSHLPDVVYCKQTRDEGGSNSDDIRPFLPPGFRVDIIPTSLAWADYQSVLERKPVLVIVHASAFYRETQPMEGNTRLLNFLDALRGSKSKILVYTRGLPDEAPRDTRERWERIKKKVGELNPQAQLFVMPRGQNACFRDPDDKGPFQNKVREILSM